jgi:N-acetylglucosaminyldiphosphoundecaprenol N-acetyl-beta-D-mannosaminyltransferase
MKLFFEEILSYTVYSDNLKSCVEHILTAITDKSGELSNCKWLACLNPHSYVESLKDSIFSKALRDATWLVPDGIGIVIASKIKGGGIVKRITGSDIFDEVHVELNKLEGYKVFFLGSTEDTLEKIREKFAIDFPNIQISGTYSPPFKSTYTAEEMQHMIDVINIAKPDLLWVGMTAPKQEKLIYELKNKLNVKFIAAVGAVFDFYVGKVKRSHPIFQRLGLEWLPRLVQQPKRLWKRTLVSAPIFIWHVFFRDFN